MSIARVNFNLDDLGWVLSYAKAVINTVGCRVVGFRLRHGNALKNFLENR